VINGLANVVNAFNQQQQQFREDTGPLNFFCLIGPAREKMISVQELLSNIREDFGELSC